MSSDGSGVEEIRYYYETRFAQYGDSPQAFWGNEESQKVRFAALTRIGDLRGSRILDVGCGSGDFLTFLDENGLAPDLYDGCDISMSAIEAARRKHPRCTFYNLAILGFPLGAAYDYVLASGLFALAEDLWLERTLRKLQMMWSLCRKGIGANFLSAYGGGDDEESHYSVPGHLFDTLQEQITPRATLLHDYRGNDFTVFLYKRES